MAVEVEVEHELRAVPGFPGLFASDTGRVWRERGGVLKPVTPWEHESGYHLINARDESGKSMPRYFQRLVAAAFHGPPPSPTAVARHLNGDPLDNRPSNLAWGTPADNSADTVRQGRSLKGTANPSAKLNPARAYAIREFVRAGWTQAATARHFGVSKTTLSRVVRGQRWAEESPAVPAP